MQFLDNIEAGYLHSNGLGNGGGYGDGITAHADETHRGHGYAKYYQYGNGYGYNYGDGLGYQRSCEPIRKKQKYPRMLILQRI